MTEQLKRCIHQGHGLSQEYMYTNTLHKGDHDDDNDDDDDYDDDDNNNNNNTSYYVTIRSTVSVER